MIDNSDYQIGWKSQFTFCSSGIATIQTGGEHYQVSIDDYRDENGFDTTYVFDSNDYRPNPATFYIILDPRDVNSVFIQEKFRAGAFADCKYGLSERWTTMPGARDEYNGLDHKHYVSPRFSASYQWSDRTRPSAATGVYSQEPGLRHIVVFE